MTKISNVWNTRYALNSLWNEKKKKWNLNNLTIILKQCKVNHDGDRTKSCHIKIKMKRKWANSFINARLYNNINSFSDSQKCFPTCKMIMYSFPLNAFFRKEFILININFPLTKTPDCASIIIPTLKVGRIFFSWSGKHRQLDCYFETKKICLPIYGLNCTPTQPLYAVWWQPAKKNLQQILKTIFCK